jgi:hypothetical protein
MSDKKPDAVADAPLNPALKRANDTTFDTERTTPAPIDTASATGSEGKGWPIVWLVVAAFCVALTVYLAV